MTAPWVDHELEAASLAAEYEGVLELESPFAGLLETSYGESADGQHEARGSHRCCGGATAEVPGALPLAHESPEQTTVRQAFGSGTTDVDQLTNLVFFARHPERQGRRLSSSEPGFAALAEEWRTIRATVVLPAASGAGTPVAAGDLWVPGAERLANAKAAGGTYLDSPWRFVFHTIEGEPSASGFRTLAAGHENPPHLWAMPGADLLLQTVPLNRSAYALARPGSIQTNRLHAVQVEMWGFAAKMGAAPPDVVEWVAKRVLAPVARLVPINLDHARPAGPGEPCYGTGSSCRMTPDQWQRFDGVCGHKDVPDNSHWDPGQFDLSAVAARSKAALGSTPGSTPGSYVPTREAPLGDHDGPGFEAERDEDEAPWATGESPWQTGESGDLATEMDHDSPPPAPSTPTPPPPPNPPLPGPVPIARNCCLLDATSLKGTTTMGGYALASLPNSGKPGTVYTGAAGFIDLGHLFSVVDVTAYGYQQIHAARGAGGTKVTTAHGEATLNGTAPPGEWLELARSIAYDDALAYEIHTYKGTLRNVPGNLNSAFSPEDLCSNYLGTVVAARALAAPASQTFPRSFASNVDYEVRNLLVGLGAQNETETRAAFAKISSRWVDSVRMTGKFSPDYLQRRNFTRSPWKAGHASDQPTPAFVLDPFRLTSGYVYRHSSGVTNAAFYAEIALIRLDAQKRFGPRYDQPT